MRMRKKKNLEDKLSSVSEYLTVLKPDDPNYNTAVLDKEYINFFDIFKNDNAVELEIGCGKGQFACELAIKNPDKNILAVEVNPNVIYMACRKAQTQNIKNLHFLLCRAEFLSKYIPVGSISRIYLNFSCPFPKRKYRHHRLTDERFLKIYKEIMTDDAEIHQKTDNATLFEYSIEEFSRCGYAMKNVSLDLHNSDFENNIMTEYEKRFTSQGMKIYRLEAYIAKKP